MTNTTTLDGTCPIGPRSQQIIYIHCVHATECTRVAYLTKIGKKKWQRQKKHTCLQQVQAVTRVYGVVSLREEAAIEGGMHHVLQESRLPIGQLAVVT